MALIRRFQTNFSGGALTPLMAARVESGAYQNGAQELRNARLLIQGGATRRPGLAYIDELGSPEEVRLEEFAFNDDQSYLFIFRPGKLDVYFRDTSKATSMTGMPWDTAAKVANLRVAQNGDTMIACHQDMPPQRIVRVGANTFSVSPFAFEEDDDSAKVFQPYHKYAAPGVTLGADAVEEGETATLTIKGNDDPIFESGHVGQIVRHKGRQIKIDSVTDGSTATGTILDPLRREEDNGVNLIADESFDNDEFWVVGPGWRVGAGKARPEENKGSSLSQNVTLANTGNSHTLTFTMSSRTQGEIIEITYGAQTIATNLTGNVTHTPTFTPETDNDFLTFVASSDFDGEIDDVKMQEGGSGTNFVNESGFDGDDFWIQKGAWTVTGGRAFTQPKTAFELRQVIKPVLQQDYVLTFDVSDSSAGTLTVKYDDKVIGTVSGGTNGAQEFEFTTQAVEGDLTFSADVDWDGALDNMRLKMKPDNGPTTDWEEQAYSSIHGWPRVPYFHSQRLIFAASKDLPNGLFMSKPAAFFNFDDGTGEDDDGIAVTLAESRIAEIRAITSLRHLQVFTSEMELYIPTGEGRPLTPSNTRFIKQTPLGSSMVEPKEFDGAVLFIPKSKATVREFIFSRIEQAYSSDVVSLLSQHLIFDPIDMDVTLEQEGQPEQYAYLVNGDGTMAVFLSNRAEETTAWTLWETQGSFEAVAAVADRVFTVTRRNLDGNGDRLFLEVFDNDMTMDMAVRLNSGTATDTWSAAHLANTHVHVTSGNFFMGEFDADGSGEVTLAKQVEQVQMGVTYQVDILTLPPELQLPSEGASVGEKRRIVKVSAVLDNTLNLRVTQGDRSATLNIRDVTDDLSLEPPAITGRQDFRLLGWDDEGTVRITQTVPLPMTLLGLNVEMEV